MNGAIYGTGMVEPRLQLSQRRASERVECAIAIPAHVALEALAMPQLQKSCDLQCPRAGDRPNRVWNIASASLAEFCPARAAASAAPQ